MAPNLEEKMSHIFTLKNWQYCCVLCGSLFGLTFLLALVALGGIPPVPPSWGAERVHEHYIQHQTGCQAGAGLLLICSGLFLPWGAVISKQMEQIPNVEPILCQLQLASCAAGVFTFMMPAIFLGLITFRDYGPEMTLMLSDLFWLSAVVPWPTMWIQSWTLAWAIFADRSPNPKFPKVVGLVNFITPIVFSSATGIHTQYHGPYAWNGAFSFWMPLSCFALEIGTDSIFVLLNIRRESPRVDGEFEQTATVTEGQTMK